MFAQLYQSGVLKNPKTVFVLLIITILSFGYYSKDFRLDASYETLLIEGDPDLAYLKEVTDRYGSKEFLILTYTPNEGMVTDNSINNLLSLKYKIQSLNWVHSVITLLDVPLLSNSNAPLQERLESFKTLKDEGVDKYRGFKEILNTGLFRISLNPRFLSTPSSFKVLKLSSLSCNGASELLKRGTSKSVITL